MSWESWESGISQKKFPKDERIWHIINQYISLNDEEIRNNNRILRTVLDEVIDFLKTKDSFFRDYFQEIVFAGSYYKGTKVGAPDEFDLNLVIRLPVKYGSIVFEQDEPGYTKIRLSENSFLPKWDNHKKLLMSWLSVGWISTDWHLRHDKFRRWMEGLFSNMSRTTRDGYQVRISKSGPAFTLTLKGVDLRYPVSVDLVPVLEFRNEISLQREGIMGIWHAVPKPLESDLELPEVQWRISFYTLEKSILKRYDNGYMKPVIRQLKKLRDKYQWNFASYYIETLCLSELDKSYPFTLQRVGSTRLFLHMLQQLKNACTSGRISNYWAPQHNLIQKLPKAQLANMAGLLTAMIKKISNDPLLVADFILTKEELQNVQRLIDGIRNGQEYEAIPNEPLKLENNSSWSSIIVPSLLLLGLFIFGQTKN